MINNGKPNYYLSRIDKYWRQLGRLFKASEVILPEYIDPQIATKVSKDTYVEFQRVLSILPYIGGDDNPLTFTFVSSAAALAYIRVLERHELAVETIGQLLLEVYTHVFTSLPGILRWYLRWHEFSTRNLRKLRAFADWSQSRRYPANWVMEFVEGDGEDFDFGCDYTECAVLKFYNQMGAEAYMPYICVTDFAMSRALRTGLHRTTTLQYGGECCDFRYKVGHLGMPALPLENLPEYRNRKI